MRTPPEFATVEARENIRQGLLNVIGVWHTTYVLIEAARRNNAAAKELLTLVNAGGSSCEELREMMRLSEATTAVLKAAQTSAASLIAKMQRHGDGGVGVLAEAAGLSRRDARGQVATAEAIARAPSIRDAVESGQVSQANARRLAEAVNKTSAEAVEADDGLLAKAATLTPEKFTKEARRWTADRQDDGGEREYQRLRAKRKLRIWNADDGTVQLHGVFDPVTGKRIETRLRNEARRMYEHDKRTAAVSRTGGPDGQGSGGRGKGRNGRFSNTCDGGPGAGAAGRGGLLDAQRRTYDQCMADSFDNLTSNAPASATSVGNASGGATSVGGASTGNGTSGDKHTSAEAAALTGTDAGTGASVQRRTGESANRHRSGNTAWADRSNPDGDADAASAGADAASHTEAEAGTDAGQPTGTSSALGRPFADISVNVHVDGATGKLIAELPDGSRLPEAVLEELVCNARLTGFVYGTTGTAIWQTKTSRTATDRQRRALLKEWGGCFHCAARPDMCQIHHIVPVSRGGATKIDNMVPVCWDCHQKIHHHGWQIRKRPGGQHSLHPPNSTHHGPAHAPKQPLLFTQESHDHEDPATSPPSDLEVATTASSRHPRSGSSGPATARAALGPRRPTARRPALEPLT